MKVETKEEKQAYFYGLVNLIEMSWKIQRKITKSILFDFLGVAITIFFIYFSNDSLLILLNKIVLSLVSISAVYSIIQKIQLFKVFVSMIAHLNGFVLQNQEFEFEYNHFIKTHFETRFALKQIK